MQCPLALVPLKSLQEEATSGRGRWEAHLWEAVALQRANPEQAVLITVGNSPVTWSSCRDLLRAMGVFDLTVVSLALGSITALYLVPSS